MFDRLDDTIVAVSSPPGMSVRGIIRLSGPRAFLMAAAVFDCVEGPPLAEAGGHRRLRGRLRMDADAWVPAESYTFRAPASYTHQDVVELHTVGSPPVLAMVLDQLTNLGARPAEPGEFTARAYFGGAIDLTEVEGVAAMIGARSDAQLRASEALLHGKLSRRSTQLRNELADLLALLEAEIDFAEEPIDFVSTEQIITTIGRVADELEFLLTHCESAERLEVLPEVILVGPPNGGKSTLFNCLTGMDRAIRSATAGTTRDVLSAPITVPGGELMLSDTAGLAVAAGLDAVEEMAGEKRLPPSGETSDLALLTEARTRQSIASADLILVVVDVTDTPHQAVASLRSVLSGKPVRIVANKIDGLPADQLPVALAAMACPNEVFAISAATGEGIAELRAEVGETLFSEAQTHGAELLALSNRQRHALREAHGALSRARAICDQATSTATYEELLALEVREAMHALSLLVGEVATEDLLGRIFSRFCIGK